MWLEKQEGIELAARDTVLLGTDGLWDNLFLSEIVELIRAGELIEAQWQAAEGNVSRKMFALASAVQENAAAQVHKQLFDAGIRTELNAASETLNKRIRQAQTRKVPYMLIAGDREVEDGQVSVRLRSGENLDPLPIADAVAMIEEKIAAKAEI